MPQLFTSLAVSMHAPEQLVCPVAQAQVPEPLHTPPVGDVHAPEVRGVALHAVPVPEHTSEPVFAQPPVPAEEHAVPVV